MLPVDQAYPSLIQKRLNEAKLRYAVINAGVSGDETIDAARRLEPLLRAHITLFVVALGINDGHRGKPIAEIRQNLRQILFRVTKAHPTAQLIVIAPGIRGSMPPEYWTEFENNYLLIANEFNATHVPALLNGVANVPERLLPRDPIHPNAKGHRTIAENIWPYIEKSLR